MKKTILLLFLIIVCYYLIIISCGDSITNTPISDSMKDTSVILNRISDTTVAIGSIFRTNRVCLPIKDTTTAANHDAPYYDYIIALGYSIEDGKIVFPDSSRCDPWLFFRGECGQEWSYCEMMGNDLINVVETVGTWWASYAVCVFEDSSQCLENLYWLGLCEEGQCSNYKFIDGCCNEVADSTVDIIKVVE